jgi:hypothetical protein
VGGGGPADRQGIRMFCKCARRTTVVEHVWGKDGRGKRGGEVIVIFVGRVRVLVLVVWRKC